MRYFFLFILVVTIRICAFAQDGYWGYESEFTPNSTEGNSVFQFDLSMTGTFSVQGMGSYPFTIYINSADGSWAINEYTPMMSGYNPVGDDDEFQFYIFYQNGTNRRYFIRHDEDDGPEYVYIGASNTSNAPAAITDIFNAETFEEFRVSARKSDAPDHRRFGAQQYFEGSVQGQDIKFTISEAHAPFKISPYMVGFLCGVFQDDVQQRNRYISKFESDFLTVEINTFSKEELTYTLDGSNYVGQDIEFFYNPTENETTRENREDLIERYNNRLDEIYRDMATMENLTILAVMGFETQLLAFNIQKASANELDAIISQADINRLKSKMRQLLDRTEICEAMPNYPEEPKQTCNEAVWRLEFELSQELVELGMNPN